MAVVLLRLSGRPAERAMAEADALIGNRGLADLGRLLVVDDTDALPDRGDVYARLLASGRVGHVVCVSVGAPALNGRMQVPESIAADRGSAVVWIADPVGVDCALSQLAAAFRHPEDGPDGAQYLIELLSSAEVFDRVSRLLGQIPNAVASPGIAVAEAGAALDGGAPVMSQARSDAMTAAVGSDPRASMWQLCRPADLALLDVDGDLPALPFAPLAARPALAGSAPADTEWTAIGHRAGLLRLVPMKLAAVGVTPWSAEDERGY